MPARTYRILAVDDVADNVMLLQTILEAEGYVVDTVFNGTQALARMTATPPNLALLDVIMPDINGYEVMQRLQQYEQLSWIPIVLVTAQDESDVSETSVTAQLNKIHKPIDIDELLSSTLALLQQGQSVDAPTVGSASNCRWGAS